MTVTDLTKMIDGVRTVVASGDALLVSMGDARLLRLHDGELSVHAPRIDKIEVVLGDTSLPVGAIQIGWFENPHSLEKSCREG